MPTIKHIFYNLWIILAVIVHKNYCYHQYDDNTDYCNVCRDNQHHIACGNTGHWSFNCHNPAIQSMTNRRKLLILDLHNKFRSRVATGNLRPFPPAARMQIIQWDNELAELAELNVKQCQMKHDECHNTREFQWSGQNLASFGSSHVINVAESITNSINAWFYEFRNTTVPDMKSYPKNPTKIIGHFTAMIQDKTGRIGCAVSTYRKGSWRWMLLACNYSYNNIILRPVYEFGSMCSKCLSGCSDIYSGLCDSFEMVLPIP